MGIAGRPVAARPPMCVPIRNAALSNKRAADALPLAGDFALAQGRLRGDDSEHGAEDVDDRGAGAQRLSGRTRHIREADVELHHLVQRGSVLVGAGQDIP